MSARLGPGLPSAALWNVLQRWQQRAGVAHLDAVRAGAVAAAGGTAVRASRVTPYLEPISERLFYASAADPSLLGTFSLLVSPYSWASPPRAGSSSGGLKIDAEL